MDNNNNTKLNEPFDAEQEIIEYEEYKLKEDFVEYNGEQVPLDYKNIDSKTNIKRK